MPTTVTIRGLTTTQLRVRQVQDRLRKAAGRAVDEAALSVQGSARRKAPVDRGEVRSGVQIEKKTDLRTDVVASAPHSAAVEYGSRPHYPPIAPLKGWARRHGMDEGAAYAIQQKIGREGTREQPFMRPAAEEEEGRFPQRVKRHVEEELRRAGSGGGA